MISYAQSSEKTRCSETWIVWPGRNFKKQIYEALEKSDVLIAVIGPNWLDEIKVDGGRRLGDPDDYVRIEIATALQRDIPVIPILLDGTPPPEAHRLPKDLEALSLSSGLKVHNDSFHRDLLPLEKELRKLREAISVETKGRLLHLSHPGMNSCGC
jgi:hypothetical protein